MSTNEKTTSIAGEQSMGLGHGRRPRGSVWRQGRRALVVAAVASMALVGSGLSSQATPGPKPLTGAALAESVAAWAKAADAAHRGVPLDPATPVGPTASPDVVATGTIAAGDASSVEVPTDAPSGVAGAQIGFSGYQIDGDLDAKVTTLDPAAVSSAVSETGGIAVGGALAVHAVDGDGGQVTSFPTEVVPVEVPTVPSARTLLKGMMVYGPNVPETADVTPGVTISIPVDVDAITAAGSDTRTLRIYTREGNGDPWTVIPSYFDPASNAVKGELDHLSEFVVIGEKHVADPTPRIVLDPDDDLGHTDTPTPPMTELPLSIRLAQGASSWLSDHCHANVMITREDPEARFVTPETRAGMAAAFGPDVTLTLAFNTLWGHAWGNEYGTDGGGSQVYDNSQPMSADLGSYLNTNLPDFTGRPSKVLGDARFPYPALSALPGAVVHLETLYMDNNSDRPVIDDGFSHITDGVVTSVGRFLEAHGYNCTDYSPGGGWPARPTAEDLARWRQMGAQNYQTFGAEPVSFATGNLFEKFPLFTLPGAGGQSTQMTLFYNSQDGRLTRSGAGWSFTWGARAQRFDDGSVLIVRADGASYMFNPDGVGGFVGERGSQATLKVRADGLLELKSDPNGQGAGTSGNQTWVFDATNDEGVGDLVSHTDANGNTTTLTYGARTDASQFSPLASLTDGAGQVISVGSDAQGQMTSLALPDGRVWSLNFDGDGNLASIGYPNASAQTFTYDGAGHHLITATSGLGVQYLHNEYDANARVVKQWDAEGTERNFTYEPGKTTYVDNEGNTHSYLIDAQFHVTEIDNSDGTSKKFSFDGNDNTTSYTDENGGRWDYEYDPSGNLTKQTAPADADGHRAVTSYTHAPGGQVASITDEGGPDGSARTTSFEIDAAGRTAAINFPNGAVEKYSYDGSGNLTSFTDAMGEKTRYSYDGTGQLTSMTDPSEGVTSFTYDTGHHLLTRTDALDGVTRYEWSGENMTASIDPLGARTTYAYDVNNHMTSMTDPLGRRTAYTWDAMFRLASTTAADGGVQTTQYNREDVATGTVDPLGRRTTLTVNALRQITSITAPDGGVTANVLDAGGRVTSTTNALGGVTSYTYDLRGNVLTQTNPLGGVTTYKYDVVGRVVAMTDPAGGVTNYAYDVMGNQTTVTDPTGAVTTSVFDLLGRVTGTVDGRGDSQGFAYDAVGNLTTRTDANGNAWTSSFDKLGRQIEQVDPNGAATTWAYDAAGRVTSRTDAEGNTASVEYDAAGQATATIDAMGGKTTYTYDQVGRITSVTDPLGAVSSTAWDTAGQRVKSTDANGVATAYTYDAGGHLASVIQNAVTDQSPSTVLATPKGVDAGPKNVTTSYTYDLAGNLATIVDGNGATSTFGYDVADNQTKYVNGLGAVWANTYDTSNRLIASVEPNGTKTAKTYTANGLLALSTAKSANGGTAQSAYTYDATGNVITMTDDLGTSAWSYDSTGRVSHTKDSLGQELSYSYDKVGNLTAKTLPSGATETLTYNKIGQALTQSTPAGELGYVWNPNGQPTSITRSNGLTSSYAYDADGRVTSIIHANPQPVAASTPSLPSASLNNGSQDVPANCITTQAYLQSRVAGLQSLAAQHAATVPQSIALDYTYDPVGNVTSRTRTNRDATVPTGPIPATDTRAYSYDALNRLTESVATTTGQFPTVATSTYGYDLAGNRTAASTTTVGSGGTLKESMSATFDQANQVTSSNSIGIGGATTSTTYTYDPSGDRTSQVVTGSTQVKTGFDYTPTGKLAHVTTPERTTSFGYDGLGRALTSTTTTPLSTDTTTTAWDGLKVAEQSSETFGTTSYGRDPLGNTAYQANGTSNTWNLADALGSTIGQTSGTTITDLADYSDYGTQQFTTDTWNADFNFTGETTDPVLNLNYYYARTYDPHVGSFTTNDSATPDPSLPLTLNRKGYVGENPSTTSDLLGRCFWDLCIAEGIALAGLAALAVGAIYTATTRTATSGPSFSWPWDSCARNNLTIQAIDECRAGPPSGVAVKGPVSSIKPKTVTIPGVATAQVDPIDASAIVAQHEDAWAEFEASRAATPNCEDLLDICFDPEVGPRNPPKRINGYKDHVYLRMTERGVSKTEIENVFDNSEIDPIWQRIHETWLYRRGAYEIAVNTRGFVVTVMKNGALL